MAKTIVNLNTIWITLAGLAFFKGAPARGRRSRPGRDTAG
jgi:hypothetical protein